MHLALEPLQLGRPLGEHVERVGELVHERRLVNVGARAVGCAHRHRETERAEEEDEDVERDVPPPREQERDAREDENRDDDERSPA